MQDTSPRLAQSQVLSNGCRQQPPSARYTRCGCSVHYVSCYGPCSRLLRRRVQWAIESSSCWRTLLRRTCTASSGRTLRVSRSYCGIGTRPYTDTSMQRGTSSYPSNRPRPTSCRCSSSALLLTTMCCCCRQSPKVGTSDTRNGPPLTDCLGYGPNLAPKNILDYTNAGGNVLLALSSETATPSAISSLLLEFDISLPLDRNSHVVDHFNYDAKSSADDHNVLLLPKAQPLRPDVMDFFGWEGKGLLAVPKAIGQTLGTASPLIYPILKAPETSYMHNPKEEAGDEQDISATGSQIALVSALQARNSARFTVLGSLEMLQDKWFDATVQTPSGEGSKTANRDFARRLTEWTFKEAGVLKVGRIEHHQVMDATKPVANTTQVGFSDPEIYRIKTDVVSYSYTSLPPIVQADEILVLLNRDLAFLSRPLCPFHRTERRQPSTRVLDAFAFPPYPPHRNIKDTQQHNLQRDLQDTRPTWNLRFQGELQASLLHLR